MSYNLSTDQQRLINMYIQQYNQTNNHIEQLLDMLEEIRFNIINVLSFNRNTYRSNRNSRQNINTNNNINRILNQFLNQRQNNYIHYDYNNPINPNLYNSINRNANNPRYTTNNNTRINTSPISNSSRQNNVNSNNYQNFNYENFLRGFDIGFNNLFNAFNSNVVVRPTEQQIQNATRSVRYGDIQEPLSETCPITLERFGPDDMVRQIHYCGHIFLPNAFNEWFGSNVRCPVCRYDIRTYTNNNESINTQTNTQTNNSVTLEDVDDDDDETSNQENSEQDTSNQENISANLVSNLNIGRIPNSNEIENVTFDLNTGHYTNDIISAISSRLFQSLLNPTTGNDNNNDRFMFDASNNVLFYETILRPNNSNNNRN